VEDSVVDLTWLTAAVSGVNPGGPKQGDKPVSLPTTDLRRR
jgi:hypothetical protein